MEVEKKGNIDKETIPDTWTQCKKRWWMNVSRDYISHKMDISKEFDADFNFQEIHLMLHRVGQIRRYRAVQQYSAERHEQAHKTNLKDSWNTSNHNHNNLPHVISGQRDILCFEIREPNPQALTQCWENRAATCKALPSGADQAAPLSPQSYAKSEFMAVQNRLDGKHPDAMIKDFRTLIKIT